MPRTPSRRVLSRRRRPHSGLSAALAGALAAGVGLAAVTLSPADAATRTPIVFVHGYGGSARSWDDARAFFTQAGYSAQRLFAYQYDSNAGIADDAAGLQQFVLRVMDRTGARQVDIVNHSMGGLVTQYYLTRLGGPRYVAHAASLAGANHGTYSAYVCSLTSAGCVDMHPNSRVVQAVSRGDETPGRTRYATWYSMCDAVIHPYDSTALSGATNTRVGCETHFGFLSDPRVLSQVQRALSR